MPPEHPKVEIAVIAGADHHMEVSVDPKTQLDSARFDEKPEPPEYFAVLASWLTKQGIARRGTAGADRD